jgi:hypothetical protein
MIHGIKKRVLVEPPACNAVLLREFAEFVDKWLKENLTPLPIDTDISFETWIETRNTYPEWRKSQLRELRQRVHNWDDKFRRCNSFMKDEGYPEYKAARAINSRTDEAKILLGPIMACIEEVLYKQPEFIKHIPVQDRPKYIRDFIYSAAGLYFQTDFSSFESCFTKDVMEACEFRLYRYMVTNLPGGKEWANRVEECGGGSNHCRFRHCDVVVEATRMSGDNWTSCGNGFTNFMLIAFVMFKSGFDPAKCPKVFEGDDGLGRLPGKLKEELFEQLGFRVKLIYHDSLDTAGFCSMYFDVNALVCVGDPVKVLVKTGWTTGQYAGARRSKLLCLLRAKAYSICFQNAGSPVLMAYARYLLRVTKSCDPRAVLKMRMSEHERNIMIQALKVDARSLSERPIMESSRAVCERTFGVPAVMQLRWEQYFDSLETLQPLHPRDIDLFVHVDVIDYFRRFVTQPGVKINQPAF